MATLRSPNEVYEAARKEMLDGRDVSTREDAWRVMNFFACNVEASVATEACKLMLRIYPELEAHMTDIDVEDIVKYQLERR
jgi:hypothetical protein